MTTRAPPFRTPTQRQPSDVLALKKSTSLFYATRAIYRATSPTTQSLRCHYYDSPMASSFEQLPSELLLHILKYTPRPSDRRSFCLTSRTFYQFALPLLYHTITIGGDLGSELTPDVKGSLIQIGHPGLVHIRRLEITAPDGRRGPDNCKVEARFVKQLLLILPRDGLRHM